MECPFCHSLTSAYSKRCSSCGEPIPPAQHLLEESGAIETSGAVAGAPRAHARAQGRYRFARLGDRFVAFALDTVFLSGPFCMVDAWAFTRWGFVDGAELRLTTAAVVIGITLNSILLFLYGAFLEAIWGATLGKAIVGIQVVGTHGRNSFSACAVRNAMRIVDGLGCYLVGIIIAACSGVRQRLGDICARTFVIEASFGKGIRILAVIAWISGLVAAGWSVPRICSSGRFVQPSYLSEVLVHAGRNENSAYFQIKNCAVNIQFAGPRH